MKSLDPRVNRLPKAGQPGQIPQKEGLDQFGTFEVFVQPKEGKPFQHEGIVHAPNLEMSYVLAKEAFTRRFTCSSLYVVNTQHIFASPITEGTVNIYDLIDQVPAAAEPKETYEIYHLIRRGKQHVHAGTVQASSAEEAISTASRELRGDKTVYSLWAIRTTDIRFTPDDDKDLWLTLPEKKFRDAGDYKGGEKLKEFLERIKAN